MNTITAPVALLSSKTTRNSNARMEVLFERVVAEGDHRAFNELFTSYYHTLCTYALRVVKYPEIAEEVVADVFVKLWKNRGRIEVHASFSAYIYRAVRNQALDYLKMHLHRVREQESLENVAWQSVCADYHSPEEELVFNELYEEVEQQVNELPKQCQLIFRLSREEGLRYREIADQLNISIKTVETQMGRALKVLRNRVPTGRLVA